MDNEDDDRDYSEMAESWDDGDFEQDEEGDTESDAAKELKMRMRIFGESMAERLKHAAEQHPPKRVSDLEQAQAVAKAASEKVEALEEKQRLGVEAAKAQARAAARAADRSAGRLSNRSEIADAEANLNRATAKVKEIEARQARIESLKRQSNRIKNGGES